MDTTREARAIGRNPEQRKERRGMNDTAHLSAETVDAKAASRPDVRYWIFVEPESDRNGALCPALTGGGEELPVFSDGQEAEAFLRGRGMSPAWRVEEIDAARLFSVLVEPSSSGVERVTLDPMPQVSDEVSACLVGVDRERFARGLAERLLARRGLVGRRGPVLRGADERSRTAAKSTGGGKV